MRESERSSAPADSMVRVPGPRLRSIRRHVHPPSNIRNFLPRLLLPVVFLPCPHLATYAPSSSSPPRDVAAATCSANGHPRSSSSLSSASGTGTFARAQVQPQPDLRRDPAQYYARARSHSGHRSYLCRDSFCSADSLHHRTELLGLGGISRIKDIKNLKRQLIRFSSNVCHI